MTSGTDELLQSVLSSVREAMCVLSREIVDYGSGFDVLSASRNGSLGLVSMEERVRFVGGELDVSSKLSVGTRISVRIPPEPKGS
jgi:signal transduction histidine kinase